MLIPTCLYYGVFDPLYNGATGVVWTPEHTIPSLQAQNVGYANALNQVTEVQRQAKKLNDDYEAVPLEVKEKTAIMLSSGLDQLKLINEVKAITDKAGIAISGLSVKQDQRYINKYLGAYDISFSTKARYPVFKELMENFEKNLRFFNINTISIKRPENSGVNESGVIFDKEVLSASVSFRVYYIK